MLKAVPKRNQETLFDDVGREQLLALLEYGLNLDSVVLDIGCGLLRGGRWLIPLLEPGHYCGLEAVPDRVQQGLDQFLDPALVAIKNPRFDFNTEFDFSVFGVQFTHFVARSIWSHASKPQIEKMLDGFLQCGAPGAVMLASLRATSRRRRNEYTGDEWIGKSHESEESGIIAHSVEWLREVCEQRGLTGELSTRGPVKMGQVWAVVQRADADAETLKARRVSQLARQIKHNLRAMRFATQQIVDELELEA